MNDKDNDISLMRSKKMKANSKTIRRMKVNVRSEESETLIRLKPLFKIGKKMAKMLHY